jgi:hypothetical protein
MRRNINLKFQMLFLFLSFIFGVSAQNLNDTTKTNTACANKTIKNPVTFAMQPEKPEVGQGTVRMTVDLKEHYYVKQNLKINSGGLRKPRTPIFLGVQLNTEIISQIVQKQLLWRWELHLKMFKIINIMWLKMIVLKLFRGRQFPK